MILGNFYAPTGGLDGIAKRKEFFNDVSNVLDNYPQDVPIILGGDFNCVLDPSDRSSPVTYVEKTAYNLKAVLSSYALEDIWRVQNLPLRNLYSLVLAVHLAVLINFTLPGIFATLLINLAS